MQKSFRIRQSIPLLAILTAFLILQIFDFARPFNHPFLFGLAKFVLLISGSIFALLIKVNWSKRFTTLFVFIFLIFGSYYLNAWKLTARVYLIAVEQEYLAAFQLMERNPHISELFYREDGDSLMYRTQPPGPLGPVLQAGSSAIKEFYNQQSFTLSPADSLALLRFMKKHAYVELWRDPYGVAFIYNRFIDNRFGVLYCPTNKDCEALDTQVFENRHYTRIKKYWYSYGAV